MIEHLIKFNNEVELFDKITHSKNRIEIKANKSGARFPLFPL